MPGGSASAVPLQDGVIAPGSAGVPPASFSFWGSLSISATLRAATTLQKPQRPSRRRTKAPLPVDPSVGVGRGCARLCAGGTPALPGSLHPHDKPGTWFTRSQGIQQGALCRPQESLPPLRGSRQDKGEARSRAGGGQTPCAVSGYPARQQFAGGSLHPPRVKDFAWPPIGICRTIGRERGGAPGFGLPAPAPSGKPGDTR